MIASFYDLKLLLKTQAHMPILQVTTKVFYTFFSNLSFFFFLLQYNLHLNQYFFQCVV